LPSRWVSFHSTRQPENGLYIVSGRLGFGPEFRAEKWRRVADARQVSEVGSTNDRYRDATQRTTPFAECAAAIACDAASRAEAARSSSAAAVTVPVAPSPRASSPSYSTPSTTPACHAPQLPTDLFKVVDGGSQ